MHRRSLLKGIGLTAVGYLWVSSLRAATEQPQQPGASPGPFSLPSLPYEYDALVNCRTAYQS
jgi:hypothetical protein